MDIATAGPAPRGICPSRQPGSNVIPIYGCNITPSSGRMQLSLDQSAIRWRFRPYDEPRQVDHRWSSTRTARSLSMSNSLTSFAQRSAPATRPWANAYLPRKSSPPSTACPAQLCVLPSAARRRACLSRHQGRGTTVRYHPPMLLRSTERFVTRGSGSRGRDYLGHGPIAAALVRPPLKKFKRCSPYQHQRTSPSASTSASASCTLSKIPTSASPIATASATASKQRPVRNANYNWRRWRNHAKVGCCKS